MRVYANYCVSVGRSDRGSFSLRCGGSIFWLRPGDKFSSILLHLFCRSQFWADRTPSFVVCSACSAFGCRGFAYRGPMSEFRTLSAALVSLAPTSNVAKILASEASDGVRGKWSHFQGYPAHADFLRQRFPCEMEKERSGVRAPTFPLPQ